GFGRHARKTSPCRARPTVNTLHLDLRADWRGGQYQAWLLLRGLVARGHHAELLTLRGSQLAARARRSGIPVHEVSGPFARLRAAAHLRRLLRRETYDLVHAHEAHAHTALWLARLSPPPARIVSRRMVFPPRTNWVSRQKYRHGLDHYIAISQHVRQSLPADANVSVVYDGVELPALPSAEQRQQARVRFGLPKEAVTLACLGALEADKGPLATLEALPLIRETLPAHLLIAGEGPLRAQLGQRMRSLGLGAAAQLIGYVDDLEAFFAATDIFLFPAKSEGLGTALLLAMAHQLPVIALKATAAAEVIQDAESGRLILSAKPGAIAGAVVYLARHPELAGQLAANARAAIAQKFTADRMVEETLGVYHHVCATHRRTA
ncbi:MAG: glycosyltransferase family 4 protein, partial [Terriglobia bacterium]